MKKLLSLALAFLLTLCVLPVAAAEAPADTAAFAGTRQVTLSVDASDLNNYFNGGRAYFDLSLRLYAPAWLSYTMHSQGRELQVTLSFNFATMEEYNKRLGELVAGDPYVSYHRGGGALLLLESHHAAELLNFVCVPANGAGLGPMAQELFAVKDNRITLNGQTYQGEAQLQVLPEGEAVIPLSSLEISTLCKEEKYTRTLRVIPADSTQQEALLARFEKVGNAAQEENTVTVTLTGYSMADISRLTARCLYVSCNVTEKETPLEGIRVGVTRTELFACDALLTEGGHFRYEYTVPSYYRNVATEEEGAVTVTDGVVSTETAGPVQFYYERDFQFSQLDVRTDLSNLFGKARKVLIFSAPIARAEPFQQALRQTFEKVLADGVTLRIHDEGATRYYEVGFSSWFMGDVTAFVQTVLGPSYQCEMADSWLPYGGSTLRETVAYTRRAIIQTPPSAITVSAVFPAGSSYRLVDGGGEALELPEERTLIVDVEGASLITVAYHRFHLFKNILVLVLLAGLGVLVWWGIRTGKRLAVKKKQRPQPPAEPEPAAEVPEPMAEVPEPAAEVPEPAAEVPEPVAEVPEPVVEVPEPAAEMPEPAAEVPEPVAAEPEPVKRFCPLCGQPMRGQFCGHCGNRL